MTSKTNSQGRPPKRWEDQIKQELQIPVKLLKDMHKTVIDGRSVLPCGMQGAWMPKAVK